jgi:hypothetical protein
VNNPKVARKFRINMKLSASGQIDRLLRREKALARFGTFAFREENLQAVLNEAARVCAECLNVPFSKICKFQQKYANSNRKRTTYALLPVRGGEMALSASPFQWLTKVLRKDGHLRRASRKFVQMSKIPTPTACPHLSRP